jgi:hypothetical protein
MGLVNTIFKRLQGQVAYDLTFVPSIPASNANIVGLGLPIEADSCYVELYLESLRLEKARKFASKFHAIVYSFISLSREGEECGELAAISKPEKLAQLDQNSLGNVITVSKQMMGATPFRGGAVSLELGLFSVKSGNVLTPVLDYVTRVSSTAGISFVGAIKPFLPLITEGMDLIAGQQQDSALEVGIETDLTIDSGCVMAIIDRPKNLIDTSKLSLDKDRKLLLNGQPLDCGYAVFSLVPRKEKSDYGEIPELKERYSAFITAIKGNKMMEAKEAMGAFRLVAIASPDLIESDRKKLIKLVNDKFNMAFLPGEVATYGSKGIQETESLSEIGLYE